MPEYPHVEIVQVLGTILPIEDFFDEDSGEPTALAREFGVPVEVYPDENQYPVLHDLEHESIPLQCFYIMWNNKDTIVLGRSIGTMREIGWGTQLKISAEELARLTNEVQEDIDKMSVSQRVGVFLYTTHRFLG